MYASMQNYINSGFNLLLHGLGSKREFLNNFVLDRFASEPKLVVNGFHSGTNLKSVTNPMMNFAHKHQLKGSYKKSAIKAVHDQVDAIKRIYGNLNEAEAGFDKFFLVVHSLDAGALKNEEWQHYLSEIAELKNVVFIASVDHIKAGMLWSEQMLDRFNFMAMEVNTFADYDCELEYQSPLFSVKNDNQEVGLGFVLKSMTENQRQIIRLIA